MGRLASIIIPVYNNLVFVDMCYEHLKRSDAKDQKIIFVNNGSNEETRFYLEIMKKRNSNVNVINLEKNFGYSKSCNIGINDSDEKYICLLHNDCFVPEFWFEEIISFLEENSEEVVAVNPMTCYDDVSDATINREIRKRFLEKKPPNKETIIREVIEEILSHIYPVGLDNFAKKEKQEKEKFVLTKGLSSYCSVIKKEAFNKVGLLDEDYYPKGYEEIDWFRRANKVGYDFFIAKGVYVHHWGNATSDSKGFNHVEQMQRANFQLARKERMLYGKLS